MLPIAVWAPAVLMPSLLLLAVGGAFLLDRVVRLKPPLGWGAGVGLVLLALWLFQANLPFVHSLVNDRRGRDLIDLLAPLKEVELPGGRDVVVLPWGGSYFAAGYGLLVSGELEGFDLVARHRDLQILVTAVADGAGKAHYGRLADAARRRHVTDRLPEEFFRSGQHVLGDLALRLAQAGELGADARQAARLLTPSIVHRRSPPPVGVCLSA